MLSWNLYANFYCVLKRHLVLQDCTLCVARIDICICCTKQCFMCLSLIVYTTFTSLLCALPSQYYVAVLDPKAV